MPLTLELSEIYVSAKLRVELGPLNNTFPCFEAITLCILHKPVIDFSFKVGSLNIMSIGPADYNVAAIVQNLIVSILNGLMVYPKKIVIPIAKDVDTKALTAAAPVGLLHLTVVGATNLVSADLMTGKSDPYVVLKFMDQTFKTRVIPKNINPIWYV